MLYTYEHEIFFHGDDEPFYYTSSYEYLRSEDEEHLAMIGIDLKNIKTINTERL